MLKECEGGGAERKQDEDRSEKHRGRKERAVGASQASQQSCPSWNNDHSHHHRVSQLILHSAGSRTLRDDMCRHRRGSIITTSPKPMSALSHVAVASSSDAFIHPAFVPSLPFSSSSGTAVRSGATMRAPRAGVVGAIGSQAVSNFG